MERDIPDKTYYSGSDSLIVPIPPSAGDMGDCPLLLSISQKLDNGEFDWGYLDYKGEDILDRSISLATPYAVPSAQISIDVRIVMEGQYIQFNVDKTWSFKIALYG